MAKIKKIGFVSQSNPFIDRKAWSGTIFKIRESIESSGFEVKWIKCSPPNFLMTILRILLKLKYGSSMHHPIIFKLMAKYTDWDAIKECDMLFFPGYAQIMNHTSIKKPYIYYTDACLHQMVNYYWYGWNPQLIKLGDKEEKMAINNALVNIRSSEWAKKCAVEYYQDDDKKNYVLEFGANIDNNDIVETIPYKSGVLNVLFSGVDWNRKGGDIAVETVRILREEYQVDAILTVAGIRELPKRYENLSFIKNLGFLNKNNPEEYALYVKTIKNSHLLLLPTKAECSAIVFCEASAYGLPTFTYDTGGIGNYIINGVNGYRLPMNSTSREFAKKIYSSINGCEFSILHEGALRIYNEKLNWNSWSNGFRKIIDSL